MNGAMVDGKFFDSGCTRDSNRVKGGSVIDYVLASPRIFPRLESLQITPSTKPDHNALTLGWYGKTATATPTPETETTKSNPAGRFSSGPKGWCFLGSLPEEKTNDFVAHLAVDPRLGEIAAACEGDDFTQASAENSLRRLHELIRDAWAACGLKVHIVSGKRASGETSDFANSIPVPTWMDDECRAVRTTMNRTKRKNKVAYNEARNHFKKLRNAKIGAWGRLFGTLSRAHPTRARCGTFSGNFSVNKEVNVCVASRKFASILKTSGNLRKIRTFALKICVRPRNGFLRMLLPTIRMTEITRSLRICVSLRRKSNLDLKI